MIGERLLLMVLLTAMSAFTACGVRAQELGGISGRWSVERANAWYDQQPWLVGANYVSSDAINELEVFQSATWKSALNNKELGLAEARGMKTVRVFLHDQSWHRKVGR